ncbi:GntR family transcriptional regulator [Acrocarpospora sp. B8E8]
MFLLHTCEYAAFCEGLAGRFLHHVPRDPDESGPHTVRTAGDLIRTVAAMQARGMAVDELLWAGMVTGTCCVGYGLPAMGQPGMSGEQSGDRSSGGRVNDAHGQPGKPQELNRTGPVAVHVQVADNLRGPDRARGTGARADGSHRGRVAAQVRDRGGDRAADASGTRTGVGTFVGRQDTPAAAYLEPAYVVIARDLATQIQAGEHEPNRRIPAHAVLGSHYEVGHGTVRHAVRVLREAGWVYARGPKGTFVASADQWPDPEVWRKRIADTSGATGPGEEPLDLHRWDDISSLPRAGDAARRGSERIHAIRDEEVSGRPGLRRYAR